MANEAKPLKAGYNAVIPQSPHSAAHPQSPGQKGDATQSQADFITVTVKDMSNANCKTPAQSGAVNIPLKRSEINARRAGSIAASPSNSIAAQQGNAVDRAAQKEGENGAAHPRSPPRYLLQVHTYDTSSNLLQAPALALRGVVPRPTFRMEAKRIALELLIPGALKKFEQRARNRNVSSKSYRPTIQTKNNA